MVPGWDTLGINLPFVTIKAEFPRGFSWKPLADRKLLTASDYATGECRYFQIAEPVFAEILKRISSVLQALVREGRLEKVKLTGKKYVVPPPKVTERADWTG